MNNKTIFRKYYRKQTIQLQVKKLAYKIFKKKLSFVPKEIRERKMAIGETQEEIKKIILAGKPAMIARFGSYEAQCTAEGIAIRLGVRKRFSDYILNRIHINAGVFPYGEDAALRFSEICEEAADNIDVLGWWSTYMQDYLSLEVCDKSTIITDLSSLEPYYSDNPWTSALKGKKVLVIHPFKETILSQYKKRASLFENPDILPEFELSVIQAVQTIAGTQDSRFEKWEDALNYMYNEAMKIDFDVAIIGCGAYGMPLAAMLKKAQKIAIHLGGPTQILFGIQGTRWDNTVGKKLYNENWVRPSEAEIPNNAKKVESGCYW